MGDEAVLFIRRVVRGAEGMRDALEVGNVTLAMHEWRWLCRAIRGIRGCCSDVRAPWHSAALR